MKYHSGFFFFSFDQFYFRSVKTVLRSQRVCFSIEGNQWLSSDLSKPFLCPHVDIISLNNLTNRWGFLLDLKVLKPNWPFSIYLNSNLGLRLGKLIIRTSTFVQFLLLELRQNFHMQNEYHMYTLKTVGIYSNLISLQC